MNAALPVLACCAISAAVPHHHHRAGLHRCHRHHHKCAAAKRGPQIHIGQPVVVDSTPPLPAPATASVSVPAAAGDELTAQESERIWTETHEGEVPVCTLQLEEEGWTCEVAEAGLRGEQPAPARTADDRGLGGLGTEVGSGYSRRWRASLRSVSR